MADRTNNSTTAATGGQIVKTVASTSVPEPISASTLLVEAIEIEAKKDKDNNNTGAIYIGFSSGNGTQQKKILSGGVWMFAAPVGKKINLATVYIDVTTANDGVICHYLN